MWEIWVWSLGWEDPWRRKQQPTPVPLPGKSHGQRRLVGYSPWVAKSQMWLSDSTFSFKWDHKELFSGFILLCPLNYFISILFFHWLLFLMMNMVSRVDTFVNSDLLFILLLALYSVFCAKMLTSLHNLKNISVCPQILTYTFKDNIV